MIKLLAVCSVLALATAAQTEKVRNERVVVTEDHIAPGHRLILIGSPSVTVYLTAGKTEVAGKRRDVNAGDIEFPDAQVRRIDNVGSSDVKVARIVFLGPGIEETWGATGEIAWRRGGTHIGHNLGKTDLWVIAVEPK